jgi:hypothetical protein
MKTLQYVLSCSVFLLLGATSALAQSVQTDYDHNFNLANLKSFAFYQQERKPGDPLAANPINDRRIHDAMDTELKANGFIAKEQPDFWIAYFVSAKRGLEIQDNRFGPLLRRGTVNVEQVTQGTMVVIFVDSASKQEVWRGYASGEITPKDLDKYVKKGVAKLVEKFKKNQAGKN